MQSPTTMLSTEQDWSDQAETTTQKPHTPEDYYKIVSVRDKYIRRFQAYMYNYNVQFQNLDVGFEEPMPLLCSICESICFRLEDVVEPDHRVRLVFESPSLNFPISLPFMRMDELTVERFLARVESVLQSYKHLRLDETVRIHFIHMKMRKGGKSNTPPRLLKRKQLLANKRCVVKIKDDGTGTCLARAIVVGQALHEKRGNEFNYILRGRRLQDRLTSDLHSRAGIREGQLGGITELQACQDVLTNYTGLGLYIVLSREHCYASIFSGPAEKPYAIYLHLAREHYDVIRSMAGFLNRSNFCPTCQKGHNNSQENHVCNVACKLCFSKGCKTGDIDSWVHCEDQICYNNHKTTIVLPL